MKTLSYHRSQIFKLIEPLVAEHEAEYQGKADKPLKTNLYAELNYTLRDSVTYENILENLMFFMIGAFDTSGRALAGALLLLAMNQHEQEKLHDEVSSVLSSETDEVDDQKLAQMVYPDLVLKETLRLIPQVLNFMREAENDIELSKNMSHK
jgi:cytochrome P450